jgi:hypothetical protein
MKGKAKATAVAPQIKTDERLEGISNLKFEISDEMQRRRHHKALEPQIRAAMADEGKAKTKQERRLWNHR